MQGTKTAVLLNDTTVDQHHGCRVVVNQIHQLASSADISITKTIPAHFDWRNDPQLCSSLSSTNLVIVNGEGTIHHSAKSAEPLLAAAKHATAHNIPSALINTSWHSNCDQFVQAAKQFTLVSARESTSAAELTQAGIACHTLPDLSILTTPPTAQKRSGIAYTDCVLKTTTTDLARIGWKFNAKPLNILYGRRSIRSFRSAAIRHRNKRTEQTLFNYPESLRFALDMTVSQHPQTETFLKNLSSFQLVITGRFHIMMLCMALQTPFIVAASNTTKNEAALKDAGLPQWRHVTQTQDINLDLINRASKWETHELEALDKHIKTARQQSTILSRKIAQLI